MSSPVFPVVAAGILLSACATPERPLSQHRPVTQPSHQPEPWLPQSTSEVVDWQTPDGRTLPYRHWPRRDSKDPSGIIIVIHGIGGAAIDFEPAARALSTAGYEIYGIELRGQGNDPDPRRRGDLKKPGLWYDDLRAFSAAMARATPGGIPSATERQDLPLVWFGESLGALVALHAAADKATAQSPSAGTPDALVLTSPVVGFREQLPKWREWLLRLLARIAPTKRIDLASFGDGGDDPLPPTSDQGYLENLARQSHYLQAFSIRLLRHVGEMVVTSDLAARRWDGAVLVQYAGNDLFTPADATREFIGNFRGAMIESRFYPDSHHLIYRDRQAPQAIDDLLQWLGQLRDGPQNHERAGQGKQVADGFSPPDQ